MVESKPLPSQSLLVELLDYDPETGVLTWKLRGVHHFSPSGHRSADAMMRAWNSRYSGKQAFTCMTEYGYMRGSLFDERYQAHRIIWKLVYNEDPIQVDHVNHVRSDNRLANLSNVTHLENSQNMAMRGSNSSGFTGVYWCKAAEKWIAKISVNGKDLSLGRFDEKDRAIEARQKANVEYGYHHNHGHNHTNIRDIS